MYHYKEQKQPSQIRRKSDTEGKSLEEELRLIIENKQPIDSSAPIMYTPCKDGVLPECDPRTDRQEIAIDATDKYSKSERAKGDDGKPFEPEIKPLKNNNNGNNETATE